MNTENVIIEKEGLIEKVNTPLFDLRQELVAKGYTEAEADYAVAGAIPNCIAMAVIKRGKDVI